MHGFFFVDQVTRLVDDRHQRIQVDRPFIENLLWRLFLLERDDVLQTVNLRADRFVRNQIREELFRFVLRQFEQVSHLLRANASVVFGHDAHVLQSIDGGCARARQGE